MMNKILFFLSGYLKCKIIKGDDNQPYLERYMIARWGKDGQYTLFLHRFLDSDSDRGIHDHPWNSLGFPLAGGYNERRLVNQNGKEKVILRDVKPFTINRIGKDDFHQIILKPKTATWTLFYHGPRVKHWGFQYYNVLDDGFIKRTEIIPYNDNTKAEDKWELTAPIGKKINREKEYFIYQDKAVS